MTFNVRGSLPNVPLIVKSFAIGANNGQVMVAPLTVQSTELLYQFVGASPGAACNKAG